MDREIHISVITVCKNEAKTIERTIQSVIHQTYPVLEYIIVDGQSNDGTLEVINQYHQQCRIVSEPDVGIYDAMNKGVNAACGDYLLFINAGDYLIHDSVIEKCARLISTVQTPVDVFFGNIFYYHVMDGSGWMWRPKRRTRLTMYMECLPHPATFFSRRAFEKNGLFDTSFQIAGDFEWFVRGMEKNGVRYHYIDTLVTLFNEGGVSTKPSLRHRHEQEKNRIYKMYYSKIDRLRFNIGIFFKKNFTFL